MKGNWIKLTGFIFAGVAAMTILSTKLAMAAAPEQVCTSVFQKLLAAGVDSGRIEDILAAMGCG